MPNCIDRVAAELKKNNIKFNESQLEAIHAELSDARSQYFNEQNGLDSPGFQKKALELIKEEKWNNYRAQENAQQNAMKNQSLLKFAMQKAFEGDPVEAFKALLAGGVSQYSKGGNLSPRYMENQLKQKYNGMMEAGLKAGKFWDIAQAGTVEKETMQAMHLLGLGKDVSHLPEEAVGIAKILNAVNASMLRDLQNSGSMIRGLMGFISKQTHDRDKITANGFDDWANKLLYGVDENGVKGKFGEGLLDKDKTFGVWKEDQAKEYLKNLYDRIDKGSFKKTSLETGVSDRFIDTKGPSTDIGAKTANSRSLQFTDGDAFYDYNKAYGKYGLLETISKSGAVAAKDASMLHIFGSNPLGGVKGLQDRLTQALEDAGRKEEAATLRGADKVIERYYDSATGISDIPGSDFVARAGVVARTLESIVKLGGAWFSAFGETAIGAGLLHNQTGQNFLTSTAKLMGDYANGLANQAERRDFLKKLGVFMDDFNGEMAHGLAGSNYSPGALGVALRLSHKLNGMAYHIEAAKFAMAKQAAMDLADHAHLAWDELPAALSKTLERYGFDDKTWRIASKAVEEVDAGWAGKIKVLTPESIDRAMSEAAPGFSATDMSMRRDGMDISRKLVSYYNDLANMASHTTGVREKAWMGRNEGLGAMIRMVTQFKQVAYMSLRTSSRILLSDPETAPTNLTEMLKHPISQAGDYAGMAQYMALTTMTGYIGSMAKDLSQGKTPADPTDKYTLMKSMVKGGAGGPVAEMMLGPLEQKDYKGAFLQSLAGPTLSTLADAGDVAASAFKKATGEDQKTGQKVAHFVSSNTPTPFWAAGLIKHYYLDALHNSFSDNYSYNQERRLEEQPGLFGPHRHQLGGTNSSSSMPLFGELPAKIIRGVGLGNSE